MLFINFGNIRQKGNPYIYIQKIGFGISYKLYVYLIVFYSPINPVGSCRVWSVYLITLLLDRLSPLSG